MDHDNQDWIWLSIIAGNQKEAEKISKMLA